MKYNFSNYIQNNPSEKLFIKHNETGNSFSWDEFSFEIDVCATYLSIKNVSCKSRIILAIEDELLWCSMFFGAVKIGAVPVLVNFRDPFAFSQIINDCEDYCIFTDREYFFEQYRENQKDIFLIEKGYETTIRVPKVVFKKENDIFFALYTSGSSGEPKYVEKSYKNILSELEFLKKLVSLTEHDTILSIVPQLHIYGILFGVFLPIMTQSTIIYSNKLLPREVIRNISSEKVDVLIAAPIHYQAFLKSEIRNVNLPQLRLAVSSGAPMSSNIADHFIRETHCEILEIYGSTETGGISYRLWKDKTEDDFHLFPYIKVFIEKDLDTQELLLSSPCISENVNPNGKLYSTGDIVVFSHENTRFRIVGRERQIIKVGGKRIPLIQIENELKTLDEVKDAAVIRIDSKDLRGESAVAVITLVDGIILTPLEIRKKLQKISIHASVIKKILFDTVPRTKNGKISSQAVYDIYQKHLQESS